jgi:phage terminase large subunit-like protein
MKTNASTTRKGRKTRKLPLCAEQADSYARGVVDGTVIANARVRDSCRRYLLERGQPGEHHVWWDDQRADDAREFALKCGQGAEAGAGTPLVWMPWQCLVAMILLARRRVVDGRKTDTPATKALLLAVARGNGKTEFAASLLMAAMRDPGQRLEFASVAPDGRLAQKTFERMQTMCSTLAGDVTDKDEDGWRATGGSTPAHPGRVKHGGNRYISLPCTDKALDGLTTRLVIADEVSRMERAFGRLLTGLAKFPTSQLLAITTPDPEQKTRPIWGYWDQLERAIASGEPYPAGWWPMLYGLEQDDQAADPATWGKAHPALGAIIDPAQLELAARTMLQSGDPAQIAEFETQLACRYHELATTDIDLSVLERQMQPCDWSRLAGAPAVVAIDLSRGGYGAQLDLTSLCIMVVDGPIIRARNISWWAGLDPELDAKRSRHPLPQWFEKGNLRRMPGEWHDMAVIEAALEDLMARYEVRKIGVDPHPAQARDIKRWADKGWPIVPIDQSIRTMAPAWKLWGDLLKAKQLFYDPDPVLVAALNSVRLIKDNVGNIRPVKGRSAGNTDAVIAGNMAALLMEHHQVREVTGLASSKCPIG